MSNFVSDMGCIVNYVGVNKIFDTGSIIIILKYCL